jgi:hypothetical protein
MARISFWFFFLVERDNFRSMQLNAFATGNIWLAVSG